MQSTDDNSDLDLSKLQVWPETPLEEQVLQVCKRGTVVELIPLLDQLRAESTKLQDYRPYQEGWHIVLTMLHQSIKNKDREVLRYLVDTFNPTRYGSNEIWAFDVNIAAAVAWIDVDTFRYIWQYNDEIATRLVGHLGNPLTIAMVRNNLPLAEFMLENGADPVNDVFGYRPISQNNWEWAGSEEMRNLLKRYADSGRYESNPSLYN